MFRHYLSYILVITVAVLLTATGCASKHGKLALLSDSETGTRLADLMANTDQYTIHYHGNSEEIVSGILFDPKNDAKTIKPEGLLWAEVNDPQTVADIVDRIKRGDFPGYIPQLYKITGTDGDFYGYIFTGWSHLVIKPVDANAIRVYGLQGPPEYESTRPGGGI